MKHVIDYLLAIVLTGAGILITLKVFDYFIWHVIAVEGVFPP